MLITKEILLQFDLAKHLLWNCCLTFWEVVCICLSSEDEKLF